MDETVAHPAVAHVRGRADTAHRAALARLERFGLDPDEVAAIIARLLTAAQLTVNFHPDRRDRTGRTVAEGICTDGRYRSQYATGISNGGRTAVPDGDRTMWEASLFDGLYLDGSREYPIYGCLDPFADPYGGSPRFGSCHLVLKPHCVARTTVCVGDSHLEPTDLGTSRQLSSVLAGLLEACHADGFGRQLTAERAVDWPRATPSARALDHYLEAQIHGGIDLADDVSAVMLDPSFRGTATHSLLADAAARYGFALGWNEGSRVRTSDIDPAFRGPEMIELAHSTARADGWIDAAAIGDALANVLADVAFTPPSVAGDPESSPLQRYKKLWHCCLHFGQPVG